MAAARRGRKRRDAVDHDPGAHAGVSRRRRFAGTYGGRRLELTDVAGTFGDAALAADATFELEDGIELDVAGEWSGPLAGVAGERQRRADAAPGPTSRFVTSSRRRSRRRRRARSTAGPFRVDVVNEWQNLAWPGVAGVASPSGRLALAGSLDDYRYDGTGTLDIAGRAASFTVAGTGRRFLLELAPLELTPAAPGGGTLRAAGSVDLESRETSLELAASRFDPSWVVAAWPGRLDGTARLRAGLVPEPNVALDAIELGGELRGYPVTLGGAAALTGRDRVRLDALRLDSGVESRRADGRARPRDARPRRRREARRARSARSRRRTAR